MSEHAKVSVLIVEGDAARASLIRDTFAHQRERLALEYITTLAEARVVLRTGPPDLIIAAHRLPDGMGVELSGPEDGPPLILLMALGDDDVDPATDTPEESLARATTAIAALPAALERTLRVVEHQRRRAEEEQAEREARARLAAGVAERTQELVEANAELVQAARLREDLMAGVSHELRTPVATVLGQAEALRAGVYGELSVSQAAALARIERSGEHLLSLINDLLDVSRAQGGVLMLERRWVAPGALLDGCVELLGEAHLRKGVCLIVEDHAAGWEVRVDARRVQQVLLNLVDNAVKFTDAGGQVSVSARWLDGEGALELVVRDSGVGIAPEDQDRVFEPFIQLQTGLSRPHSGVGLGLSLVRQLVALHGGQLRLASAPEKGSTFVVALPTRARRVAQSLSPGASRTTPARAALSQRPRVVLAHRGPAGPRLRDVLSQGGQEVELVHSAVSLLATAVAHPPGVVVLALDLEGDGLGALRRLRAHGALAEVPVLALMTPRCELALALGSGADLALPASTAPAHLSRAVRSLMRAAEGP